MTSPLSDTDSLRIGSVDFVSPDEIKVLLDIEAPNDVALNAGVPRPFPRINSYSLIPNESGFLVAQIEWITIERSQYPKRKGMQDFGIIDLPYPLRKMSLNPLGVLREKLGHSMEDVQYEFSRGIEVFPTVGDPVLLPTQKQLKSIVESCEKRRVNIGVSPLAGNAVVSVDPDRLFGRHLAILGNTGSGKSCSVAGIIRWSIEAAQRDDAHNDDMNPNTRFIILDPNGEYATAFSDMNNVRVYGVEEDERFGIKQLRVPLWLWNSEEWVAFTQASSRAQRPTLVQALRTVRDGQDVSAITPSDDMRRYLRTLIQLVKIEISSGTPWAGGGKSKGFKNKVMTWKAGIVEKEAYTDDENNAIRSLQMKFDEFLGTNTTGQEEWPNYTKPSAVILARALEETYYRFGGDIRDTLPIDADIPRPFSGEDFLHCLEANAELMGTSEYVETMIMRIRTLLSDSKLKKVISSDADNSITLKQWLNDYICVNDSVEGSITVIDLSLVPAELTHIIAAVIARITLETLQRYRKSNNGLTFPTTIVMEEAHTFIKRYNDDSENGNASQMCTKVFEKIAREGRKFGLGLVLSSQRPSELSPTVLSQCNSFLLHRISNDRDQEIVSKLVPDNLRGLLRELPSLPSQNAILLGWASELPVMVRMNYLKAEHRPKSDDPDYWKVWTEKERKADWESLAESWQGYE